MEVERQSITQDPVTGSQEVVHTAEHVPSRAAVAERKAIKASDYIWYVVGVINTILVLRMIFLLFSAKDTGFASLLYSVSAPFAAPFKGIFTSPGGSTGYFDTAALLAIVVYTLVAWGIVALIEVSSRNKAD